MPVSDVHEESKVLTEQNSAVELLIGVTGDVNPVDAHRRAVEALERAKIAPRSGGQVIVSWPGADGAEAPPSGDGDRALIPYRVGSSTETGPWAQISAAQRGILALAAELKAGTCLLVSADMAALQAETMRALATPVLDRQCDVVMPIYPLGRYEGLVNTAIVMPLTRALYCKRVQMPLPLDFGVSARFAEMVSAGKSRGLLWPSIAAAQETMQVGQAHLRVRHHTPMEGVDVTGVLTQIVGSLFQEMEHSAAAWQRGRSGQPTPIWGEAVVEDESPEAIDPQPMIESFQLAARNLDELWQLVLPPVTLLELKHLAKCPAEQFRMQDRLWARIVYDFGLAHRLRTISRVHLLGALTPLYLGWVASYVRETVAMSAEEIARRQEQLARAFEENKPYLVSRWRWPDRFNP